MLQPNGKQAMYTRDDILNLVARKKLSVKTADEFLTALEKSKHGDTECFSTGFLTSVCVATVNNAMVGPGHTAFVLSFSGAIGIAVAIMMFLRLRWGLRLAQLNVQHEVASNDAKPAQQVVHDLRRD